MTLGELIGELSKRHPSRDVPFGFFNPHSYRGYYTDLAFEPIRDTTVGDMLDAAKSAMGQTFIGYKGGECRMGEFAECWIARKGSTHNSEQLTSSLLAFMLGEQIVPAIFQGDE